MSLRDLYQEIIIDHGKTPRNYGHLVDASHSQRGHNPLCGDQLILSVKINNDVIEDLRFSGSGCAISLASASLMTEAMKGKTILQMQTLFEQFHHLVTTGDKQSEQDDIGKLAVFSGVAEFPIRVKCATLAWHTLKSACLRDTHGHQQPVSTE